MTNIMIDIRFWGTRGSIPAPGKQTVRYGGNTPCVSVEFDKKTLFIIDGGTGIRELGLSLAKSASGRPMYLFISHSHWDHIQGIPFFVPIYQKQNTVTLLSNAGIKQVLKESLIDLFKHPYFPVSFSTLPSTIRFQEVEGSGFCLEGVAVEMAQTVHPDPTTSYKFTFQGRTIVYMTDNELSFPNFHTPEFDRLVDFVRGVDVLIHDTMYTCAEYKDKIGWGHSCYEAAVQLACSAEAQKLVCFHYDPTSTDRQIDERIKHATAYAKTHRCALTCVAAHEGLRISL